MNQLEFEFEFEFINDNWTPVCMAGPRSGTTTLVVPLTKCSYQGQRIIAKEY